MIHITCFSSFGAWHSLHLFGRNSSRLFSLAHHASSEDKLLFQKMETGYESGDEWIQRAVARVQRMAKEYNWDLSGGLKAPKLINRRNSPPYPTGLLTPDPTQDDRVLPPYLLHEPILSAARLPASNHPDQEWKPMQDDSPDYKEWSAGWQNRPCDCIRNMASAAQTLPKTFGMEESMKPRILRQQRENPSKRGPRFRFPLNAKGKMAVAELVDDKPSRSFLRCQ